MSFLTSFLEWFTKLFGIAVVNLFKQAAKTETGLLAEGLKEIAVEVVSQLFTVDWTGEEKREAALIEIRKKAYEQGKLFTTASVQTAQQLAYNILAEQLAKRE